MRTLVLLAWLLVNGAGATEQPRSESATLIIYRQREFGGNSYDIRVNGKEVGTLPTNRYLKLTYPPGRVKIESVKDYFSDDQVRWLTLQPGQAQYVKAVEDIDFLSRTLLLIPVSETQAQQDLRRLKPAANPADNRPADTVPKSPTN